ncbi:hypothetical protein [Streptomyces sp. NPDC085665]
MTIPREPFGFWLFLSLLGEAVCLLLLVGFGLYLFWRWLHRG